MTELTTTQANALINSSRTYLKYFSDDYMRNGPRATPKVLAFDKHYTIEQIEREMKYRRQRMRVAKCDFAEEIQRQKDRAARYNTKHKPRVSTSMYCHVDDYHNAHNDLLAYLELLSSK